MSPQIRTLSQTPATSCSFKYNHILSLRSCYMIQSFRWVLSSLRLWHSNANTNHTINFAICNLPEGCKLFNVLTSALFSSWFKFVLFFLLKQEGFGFRAKWRDWCISYTRAALSLFEPVNLPPHGVKNDPQPFSQVHLRVSLEAPCSTPLGLFCFISSADSRVLREF